MSENSRIKCSYTTCRTGRNTDFTLSTVNLTANLQWFSGERKKQQKYVSKLINSLMHRRYIMVADKDNLAPATKGLPSNFCRYVEKGDLDSHLCLRETHGVCLELMRSRNLTKALHCWPWSPAESCPQVDLAPSKTLHSTGDSNESRTEDPLLLNTLLPREAVERNYCWMRDPCLTHRGLWSSSEAYHMYLVYQCHPKVFHFCEVAPWHGYGTDTTQILFSLFFFFSYFCFFQRTDPSSWLLLQPGAMQHLGESEYLKLPLLSRTTLVTPSAFMTMTVFRIS